MAELEKACPSLPRAPPPHLLGMDLPSPSLMGSPGSARGISMLGNPGLLACGRGRSAADEGPLSTSLCRLLLHHSQARDGSPFIWGPEREEAGISHSGATRSSHQEILV